MEIVKIILIVLECVASLVLIAAVLIQSGKEAGLSGALAGNAETYMSKNHLGGWDKKIASWTKWIALVWILLTLFLSMI
ncbi:MAG: preprotein translocase subunit SecG [Oscillospiraceae bacterium]|nr:preprotein translocase subunit SecG [Oscillospiraceae bacterium]